MSISTSTSTSTSNERPASSAPGFFAVEEGSVYESALLFVIRTCGGGARSPGRGPKQPSIQLPVLILLKHLGDGLRAEKQTSQARLRRLALGLPSACRAHRQCTDLLEYLLGRCRSEKMVVRGEARVDKDRAKRGLGQG